MGMTPDFLESVLHDYSKGFPGHAEGFCNFRDAFSARLDSYIRKSRRYLEGAIIGEIGNNTFDHNFNFSENFPRGIYFDHDAADLIVLV